MKNNASRSIIALSSTALALPGIALADAPSTKSTISYKFSNYQEDELSLSGASPWFTSLGLDGEPIVNPSGPSGINDRRSELSIGSR